MEIIIIAIILGSIGLIVHFIGETNEDNHEKRVLEYAQPYIDEEKIRFDKIIRGATAPNNRSINDMAKYEFMVCHIWKENDKLYIVPSWEDIVSRIKSWSTGPQVHSVTHDDRTSYILYKDENRDVKNIHLTSPSSYEVLKNVIPDKDYNYIMLEQADDQKDSEEDILEKLTKLAQLRDQDIVSEEEFSIKKQELLSRL